MKIALTQMDIVWEEKEINFQHGKLLLEQAVKEKAEIIIFPEMSFTGFSMNVEKIGETVQEKIEGYEVTATGLKMLEWSRNCETAIVFGYVKRNSKETGKKANNCLMVVQKGHILAQYDKIHPFTYGEEGRFYQSGNHLSQCKINGMSFGFFICYDLRFPEIFQAISGKSQAIIVIANWPSVRIEHWKILLQARAIENQCYMLGINRIGEGNGIFYQPSSIVFDPYGKEVKRKELERIESKRKEVKGIELEGIESKRKEVKGIELEGIESKKIEENLLFDKKLNQNKEIFFVEINPDYTEKYREEFPLKKDRQIDFYSTIYSEIR